jgi:hypothetical protein
MLLAWVPLMAHFAHLAATVVDSALDLIPVGVSVTHIHCRHPRVTFMAIL